jgi:hypothetical protein
MGRRGEMAVATKLMTKWLPSIDHLQSWFHFYYHHLFVPMVCLKDMFRVQEAPTTTLYIGLYVF